MNYILSNTTHTSSLSYYSSLGCYLHSNVRIAWQLAIKCRQAFTVQCTSEGVYNRRCTQPLIKSWQRIPHLATHVHPLKYAIDSQTREGIGIRQVAVLVGYIRSSEFTWRSLVKGNFVALSKEKAHITSTLMYIWQVVDYSEDYRLTCITLLNNFVNVYISCI